MGVYSTTFGSIKLTGSDAEAFLRQIDERSPDSARETVERGKALHDQFARKGYVIIPLGTDRGDERRE